MKRIELVEKAIEFAMSALCDGYLDMPCGCEGCPLWSEEDMDEDCSADCRGNVLKEFLERYSNEFEGG